jgi:sulfur carrier protein ThiS
MRIRVKVTGVLEDYLPAGSSNPMELNVGDGASPMDVIRRLRLSTNDRYLIAVNGDVVLQSEQASHSLGENDSISIMPPLKGG